MGSETKVGLLVGMCFIICFAIILAHRGAPVKKSEPRTFDVTDANETPRTQDANLEREPSTPRVAERTEQRAVPPRRPVTVERTAPTQSIEREAPNSGRFGRRTDPIPAPAPARPAQRDFADSFAAAISSVGNREDESDGMMEEVETIDYGTTTQGLLQAARPLVDAGRRAVDALSYAGTQLADQAQSQQRSREVANQTASRRPESNQLAMRDSSRETEMMQTTVVNRPTQLPTAQSSVSSSGQTRGVTAPITAHIREATSSAPVPTYEVKPGDSLTRIAREVYGDDSRTAIDRIFEANQPQMQDRDHVIVGMKLKVPPMAGAGRASTSVAAIPSDSARTPSHTGSIDRLTQAVSGRTSRSTAPDDDSTLDSELAAAKRDLRAGIQRLQQANADMRSPRASRVTESVESTKQHTVQPGETLVKIVRKNYGTDAESIVRAVYEANRDHLRSPDRILVGMKLDLPNLDDDVRAEGAGEIATRATTARDAATSTRDSRPNANDGNNRDDNQGEWFWYTLKPGDLYSTLAQEYLGSSRRWKELANLNADIFEDPSHICHGVKIRIPGKAPDNTLAMSAVGANR